MYSEHRQSFFWPKVDKTDSCWNWTGAQNVSGYGQFSISKNKRVSTHRYSWACENLYSQEWHEFCAGAWVLHTCDNKLCVNPEHLYLGDALQNAADAMNRYRTHTKITDDQVVEIRTLRSEGAGVEDLGRQFGVSCTSISHICLGRTRKRAGGPILKHWALRKKETRARRAPQK